jgi:bifunctional DNA-binding transcriptional regulator/antitoxin component of YhaV-PrlF toxin-antitoxin module
VGENHTMKASTIRVRWQTTLPKEIARAAGLQPGDQVVWRFEDGEIHGRKVQPVYRPTMTKAQCLRAIETSPLRFTTDYDRLKKEIR